MRNRKPIKKEDYLYGFSAQPNLDRYIWATQFVDNRIVLDVACANGFGSKLLLEGGANNVIGGDISSASLLFAKENYKNQNLYFIQLNACELPFSNNCFDMIVSLETIEHLPQYRKFLEECKRILKPCGIIIISTPNKLVFSEENKTTKEDNFKGYNSVSHVKEFFPFEFHDLLKEYFDEVKLYGHYSMSGVSKIKRKFVNIVSHTGKLLLSFLPVKKEFRLVIKNIAVRLLSNPVSLENISNNPTIKFPIRPFNSALKQANLICFATKNSE